MTAVRRLLMTALAAFVLAQGAVAADPLEGDWKINGDGATLRFVASSGEGGRLDVLWLDGPALDIAPLTVIGSAVPGAAAGTYDCCLDTGLGRQRRRATFALRLNGDGGLAFEAYRRRARISLWRLVPYLFRVSVIKQTDRPSGLDGARRVGAPPSFIVI